MSRDQSNSTKGDHIQKDENQGRDLQKPGPDF